VLRERILRDTSRSFYLSIRLLPAGLRDPIALGYLLARATDTIADTAEISVELRTEQLAKLAAAIQSTGSIGSLESLDAFAARQTDSAERALIEAVPECLAWLASLPAEDAADIREVLAHINEGQTLDVERFGNPAGVTALATAENLERYTYLVAGSVGEFWTRVCFRHLPRFSSAAQERMMILGRQYGDGLQLINILRDAGSDLLAGRCYLPEDELQSLGLTPGDVLRHPERAEPIIQKWRARAEQGIAGGIEYACAIQPFRVRMATALPALIGARTLALLRQAGAEAFARKIKVPRSEVRAITITALASLASASRIRKMFARLSAS
jgi:farnesyl-diphosphate farnesyltransferase